MPFGIPLEIASLLPPPAWPSDAFATRRPPIEYSSKQTEFLSPPTEYELHDVTDNSLTESLNLNESLVPPSEFEYPLKDVADILETAPHPPPTQYPWDHATPPQSSEHSSCPRTDDGLPPLTPCIKPLAKLNKTMINELVPRKHHKESYLLVRTVTPQYTTLTDALTVIAEDEKRDVLMVQLYHQEEGSAAEEDVKKGTVLMIKEPYLRVSPRRMEVSIEHPCEVIFLAGNDERIPEQWRRESAEQSEVDTVLAWCTKASDHMIREEYRSAIACYNRALCCSASTEMSYLLWTARADAFLKAERFDDAVADVDKCPPTSRGLLRKAQALYNLRRYRECMYVLGAQNLLEDPNRHIEDDQVAQDLLNRATRCFVKEGTLGKYEFRQLQEEAAELKPPQLDHGTYVGPVEIRESKISGRGLFVTKAVKAGDLLLCEKAFQCGTYNKQPEAGRERVSDILDMTIRKLHRNPSLIPHITKLYHGSYEAVQLPEKVDGVPVVDTFLMAEIIALNVLSCPNPSTKKAQEQTEAEPRSQAWGWGLWEWGSYVNHSCNGNVKRSFIGDMLIVRATRHLDPNTELTWPYIPRGSHTTAWVQDKLFATWGFKCKCTICEDDQRDPCVTTDRMRLVALLGSRIESLTTKNQVIDEVDWCVARLADTYQRPAGEVPRLQTFEAICTGVERLEQLEFMPGDDDFGLKEIKLRLEALEALGYVIDFASRVDKNSMVPKFVVREWGLWYRGVIQHWEFFRVFYHALGQKFAEEYVRKVYRMVYGEDETIDELL
ncbi:hypothetical protein B0H66DRAFT_469201 [Apodospora peruviana]|uniref:SET domain-containing protein n=1 Tax=Apodospora peruviana TaxID=516989 RepID=A0AAE0IUD8_9PEZI|nr:hypothetical protein B0H66DRAFT_469201 [Apodospora peruviana]